MSLLHQADKMDFKFCILLALMFQGSLADSGCFRAAVLDHVAQSKFSWNQAYLNIDLNLKMFDNAAEVAKENGADIIVFPESCPLGSVLPSRTEGVKYHETVPNPGVTPCGDEAKNVYSVVPKLSCMAKKHQMFLVADIIDNQRCEDMGVKNNSDACPSDKHFLFNTAVAFDREGKLIGKYHKMHPFGEMKKNPPPREELVVMDTELGRLSVQICFDMIFEKPSHYLAMKHKVDTVLFPTFWFDEAPFLSASQYQSAWAIANKVNVLASNLHEIQLGTMGSGVYSGSRNEFVTVNAQDVQTRVILGNLPKSVNSTATCELDAKIFIIPQEVPQTERNYWHQAMNLAETDLFPLDQNSASGCSNGLCCKVEFKADKPQVKDYYLMITNRTRPGPYPWTEEYCAFIKCPNGIDGKCSLFDYEDQLHDGFSFIKLSGEFSPETTVYPSAIGVNHEVIHPKNNWIVEETTGASGKTQTHTITFGSQSADQSQVISTLSLYGRVYSRDPTYEQAEVDDDVV